VGGKGGGGGGGEMTQALYAHMNNKKKILEFFHCTILTVIMIAVGDICF
jgi:hypothetical protein